jgi:hypothetical protein
MLAGPPPPFKTDYIPSTMQQQRQPSSQMYPNNFQPPALPPNFPSNPQHPYLNSGLPTLSTPSQQFDVPPKMVNPPFPNSLPPPPPPSQPLSHINGASPYQRSKYPRTQSPYNSPPSSFPSDNQPPLPTGYPSQPHYSNLSGSPSLPGNQLNAPSSYPGQPISSGPVQQPFPQSRIDPDMIPNVVRQFFSSNKRKHHFIYNRINLDSST